MSELVEKMASCQLGNKSLSGPLLASIYLLLGLDKLTDNFQVL